VPLIRPIKAFLARLAVLSALLCDYIKFHAANRYHQSVECRESGAAIDERMNWLPYDQVQNAETINHMYSDYFCCRSYGYCFLIQSNFQSLKDRTSDHSIGYMETISEGDKIILDLGRFRSTYGSFPSTLSELSDWTGTKYDNPRVGNISWDYESKGDRRCFILIFQLNSTTGTLCGYDSSMKYWGRSDQ